MRVPPCSPLQARLDKYRRAFDAVLIGDISLEWVRHVTNLWE